MEKMKRGGSAAYAPHFFFPQIVVDGGNPIIFIFILPHSFSRYILYIEYKEKTFMQNFSCSLHDIK